jgi:hypothetical protein
VDQIELTVESANFNGTNLLMGDEDIEVLSSITRDGEGGTTTSSISISRHDLTTGGETANDTKFETTDYTETQPASLTISDSNEIHAGNTYTLDITVAADPDVEGSVPTTYSISYTAVDEDTEQTVLAGLQTAINAADLGLTVTVTEGEDGSSQLDFGTTDNVSLEFSTSHDGVASGGLAGLAEIDITTEEGRDAVSQMFPLIMAQIRPGLRASPTLFPRSQMP